MSEDREGVELLVFHEDYLSVNVFLDKLSLDELRSVWREKIEGCQAPLVDGRLDGLHVFIPWILKQSEDEEESDESE